MNLAHTRALIVVGALALITVGCARKQLAVAPPPPPQPAAAAPAPVNKPATASVHTAAVLPPAVTTPRMPNAVTRARIDELLAKIEDAYFDYNKATIRTDALKALQSDSADLRDILKDYPDYKLTIEGHCDERGSAEYNIGLGDRRAVAAKDYLAQVGIPAGQLNVKSYGKEEPVCEDHDEACWQRNRRVHIVALAQAH